MCSCCDREHVAKAFLKQFLPEVDSQQVNIMEMTILLLVSTVALLGNQAVASPAPHNVNLNHIIDLAEKYNESLSKEFCVEDVRDLYESGCDDTFFCKVHDILHKHEATVKHNQKEVIVRNLKNYLNGRNANCAELLKEVTPRGVESLLFKLLEYLKQCIQRIDFNGGNKSSLEYRTADHLNYKPVIQHWNKCSQKNKFCCP
ncbi:uncharacterized protein LOC121191025 [Toxotes jaculatrix]|uniref:uncharacterized protein LOC121191025 n=1 Tax=Toxotes jaculatrix TaxID=941984 RepID=UPI001B3AB9E5|nr:uncharacterized protein LOC121191025 [Toxotes jaculatrix]